MSNRFWQIDTWSADYTPARNAIELALHNARQLGYSIPTEYDLAIRLMKGELSIPFYSDMGKGLAFGIITAPGPYIDEEFDEVLDLYMKRVKRRREHARAAEVVAKFAQGIEAPSGGETTQIGSTEGESPVGEADAPETRRQEREG